jgi:hypothetical protein
MTETESPKGQDLDLKLKANMTHLGEMTYTLQVLPANLDWKYSEADAEYRIDQYVIKSDLIRQTLRNILFKNKELLVDSIKVGSKDYLFEVQVPKRIDKERLKQVLIQIANEIKNEVVKSKTELESFKKFLDDNVF